jgi:hypothetical protein
MSAHFPSKSRRECKRVKIMYARMIIISVVNLLPISSHSEGASRVDGEGVYMDNSCSVSL